MIYKLNLTKTKDKFIEKIFQSSMKDLNDFYGINWKINIPKIIIVKDRQTIDLMYVEKTEPWVVAWADNDSKIVYILDKNNFEQQSSHKYSDRYYASLIKHELSHLFYKIVSKNRRGPVWLSEGVAIYTSGQTKLKSRPKEFKNFLEFYDKGGSEVYAESGFAVEALVGAFGKNKLLKLIKSLPEANTEKDFNVIFRKIYGFELNYKSINRIY